MALKDIGKGLTERAHGLEERISARQIVSLTGMSARPEFYSGRGAINSDLNDKILEKIYQGIKGEYGDWAAGQFVQMVADIPKLSATDFLLNLYKLEGYGWKWSKRQSGGENGIYIDGPTDEAKRAVGFATILGALSGDSSRDETGVIRNEFLRRHGIQIPDLGQSINYFY